MREYPKRTDKTEYTPKECAEITEEHRNFVMFMMNVFYKKLKNLGNKHDEDKLIPKNLKIYTYLLNHPGDENAHEEWKKIHNYSNTHHVEGFLECDKPKLQYLVEMVCDNVATAIARDAKYENIFEENKQRYLQKGLPEMLAIICANTFVDLWNFMHEGK